MNLFFYNNNLNETRRNLLVDLIIASLLEEKRSMSAALANHISDIIVGTFNTEIKVNFVNVLININIKDNSNCLLGNIL